MPKRAEVVEVIREIAPLGQFDGYRTPRYKYLYSSIGPDNRSFLGSHSLVEHEARLRRAYGSVRLVKTWSV